MLFQLSNSEVYGHDKAKIQFIRLLPLLSVCMTLDTIRDKNSGKKMKHLMLMVLIMLSAPVSAQWSDSIKQGWDKSKEYSSEAWTATQELWNSTNQMFSMSEQERKKARQDEQDQRFRQMWSEVFSEMQDGVVLVDKIKKAPESAFFSEDKKSLKQDLDVIFDKMIVLLEDENINDYRHKIAEIDGYIATSKANIAHYREQRITAPRTHMVKTTKETYDKKVAQEQENIKLYEQESQRIKTYLRERLQDMGIKLTQEQVDILLSRVDGDDIIQMSVVFDVLKKITQRLMQLTRESGEDVVQAKKYYGMNVVLLEMVNYMQDKYIEQVDTIYSPKINAILNKTKKTQTTARKLLNEENDPRRRMTYQKNIQAQELTIKAANLYKENLQDQKHKVQAAQQIITKDLQLAQNTYDTVELSADLLSVLKTSRNSFDVLMNLQVPEIVPFENLQMKNKYLELSQKISQN